MTLEYCGGNKRRETDVEKEIKRRDQLQMKWKIETKRPSDIYSWLRSVKNVFRNRKHIALKRRILSVSGNNLPSTTKNSLQSAVLKYKTSTLQGLVHRLLFHVFTGNGKLSPEEPKNRASSVK